MNYGAGILPYCIKTKRFLIAKRGAKISEPNLWTNFGGKAENGESVTNTAIREFREESGYNGNVKLINKSVPIKSNNNFIFYNFIGIVQDEFIPSTINKMTVDGDIEIQNAKWLSPKQLLKIINSKMIHPGFNKFLIALKNGKIK